MFNQIFLLFTEWLTFLLDIAVSVCVCADYKTVYIAAVSQKNVDRCRQHKHMHVHTLIYAHLQQKHVMCRDDFANHQT